ncbi:VCBS repeat-containing protein [Dyadobacter sandarakinus]|uniref:VCBS repeat-containing protein n=1 Tax=Dyadobacter sandarakinus TaxID=2747268 RepID=A0ABX7I6A2_9BACT|nr:VCBS repeat-containing protein [Dyadobacter sandarakinus]QRR00531.1 VCBS repeat-containing protein [Dyadobacter sandarakinus]
MNHGRELACIFLMIFLAACSRRQPDTLFELLPADETNVHFANNLREDDRLNILTYEYFYNGGGVGAGDFNNDGLTDLVFGGNMTESRIYLNRTKPGESIHFEDITETSGIKVPGGWARGIALVDINADGYQDIYISRSGPARAGALPNLLFINQRNNTFKEQGAAYGLDFRGNTTQAAFFDYDRDGNLDVYLVTNVMNRNGPNNIRKKVTDGSSPNADRLFRNNGNLTFTNVSAKAGILEEGYGLGISVVDVNADGWTDVYVSNDYVSNDLLYINQQDGTFKNEIASAFRHQSYSAMGNDAADIDNDGMVDIITMDMLPEGNERRKNMFGLMNYDRHLSELRMGYEPQFMRNTLQHNNGNRPGSSHPFFSETGRYSGVQATDWSWSALLADYDNDGFRDLMITNGYPRDITNRDFVMYRMAEYQQRRGPAGERRLAEALKKVPGAHVPNYLFASNHDLTFTNRSAEWGFDRPSFSNGAVYADLDNDGDLDLITNNIDEEAFIYQNHSDKKPDRRFLTFKLRGTPLNPYGFGAKIWVYSGGNMQYAEHSPYRGYQSSVGNDIHFGMGKAETADSVRIVWPDARMQVLVNVKTNQKLQLEYSRATAAYNTPSPGAATLFAPDTISGIDFTHKDPLYIDFKIQPLLPHLLSQNGPGIAVGDINGDGLEDCYIGGAFNQSGTFYVQDEKQHFKAQVLTTGTKYEEDMGSLLFDADGDGDLDLYVVSGSSEFAPGSPYYQDRLYTNDGKGHFTPNPNALPATLGSGSSVNAADFDHDGDLDLFVGGRLAPGQYPMPGESYLLRNDGGTFSDVTDQVCPELRNLGMVAAALWTDFDQDGLTDLIVTGEWMPIVFFKNEDGKLENVSSQTGLAQTHGWWNSLAGADFDEDGDVDYIVGNVGLNTEGHPSVNRPVTMFAKDFDGSGTMDPVLCRYYGNELYPVHPRDEMTSQMNFLKKRFVYYADYSKAGIKDVFKPGEMKGATRLVCEVMESVMLVNQGQGKFVMQKLPAPAQLGTIYGLATGDFNHDGHQDILMTGNSYATESISGRLDAFSGLVLAGDGRSHFRALSPGESGFLVEGDAKGLATLRLPDGATLALAAQNNDRMLTYRLPAAPAGRIVPVLPGDVAIDVVYSDGRKQRAELYYGSGYLSQSTRVPVVSATGLQSITITGFDRKKRKVDLDQ